MILDDSDDTWYAPFVDVIVSGDPETPIDHPEKDTRIQLIKKYMTEHALEFDGVWTFADKSVVLTAQIAHFL